MESLGYKYVGIWDHEFRNDIKNNEELANFVKTLDITERLEPRKAFFGGRVNATRLHYVTKPNEKVKYADFTSLYPSVQKYSCYPLGYPEIITSDFKDVTEYFGIIQCKVLPPKKLFHPVLPVKMNNKLLFGLCFKCMQNSISGVCRHSDDERSISGTWCSPELQVAIEKGYRVLKIYEVYHFNTSSQFNQQSGTKGLFSDYVNTFLRIKQQTSGWPPWCISESQKQEYINDYYIHEGIKLVYDQIQVNPGLRALAKLFLNSFWGRYGMRSNLTQTEIFTDPADFHFLIHDETKEMQNFHSISDDYIIVQWKHKTNFENEARNTNIFIACFTSMYGRLKLYDELDKLGERVIYYDTDSVIYIENKTDYKPKLGEF